jgi:hypothetical protein
MLTIAPPDSWTIFTTGDCRRSLARASAAAELNRAAAAIPMHSPQASRMRAQAGLSNMGGKRLVLRGLGGRQGQRYLPSGESRELTAGAVFRRHES